MIKQTLITGAVSLAASLGIAWGRGWKTGAEFSAAWSALCDGFFVTGILLVSMGVLFWVSTTGFFDALSYGFQGIWYRLTAAFYRGREDRVSYYDFKMTREQRRKRIHRVPLLAGAAMLVLSLACLFIWQGGA